MRQCANIATLGCRAPKFLTNDVLAYPPQFPIALPFSEIPIEDAT